MLVAILTGIVVFLLWDRFLFPHEDKMARKALVELGKELNLEVNIYDWIKKVGIFKIDYLKELRAMRERNDEIKTLHQSVDRLDEKLTHRIETLSRKAEEVDEMTALGLDTLAEHFGVEIEPFHQCEQNGFKIIKLKDKKK